MNETKKELSNFLHHTFYGLRLQQPLFYNWPIGLRFSLQAGQTNTRGYFDEVAKRASTIFEMAFSPTDTVFLVLMHPKYKRSKIRPANFVFKQIAQLEKWEITYGKVKQLLEPENRFELKNMAVIKTEAGRIHHRKLLSEIGHIDFPSAQPQLGPTTFSAGMEVYFININRQLIFNMYDDRGLDIIATDRETLRPTYEQHSDWLQEYDRKKMEEQFC